VKVFPCWAFFVVLSPILISCRCDSTDLTSSADEINVVEVTARDFTFESADEIPSGWTTFRLKNAGTMHHFLLLNRLPDGISFEDYHENVTVPFEEVWEALRTGAKDRTGALEMLVGLLPEWYGSVTPMGGPGLIAGGKTAETTLKLEPGNYVMECYLKASDGRFHTSLGMIRPLTVSNASSDMAAPEADIELALSNFEITVTGEVSAGPHTIAVQFFEHPQHGLGNDVHLVRMTNTTELSEVVEWMDWMNMTRLQSPAPAEFLGGTQEMPVGSTAFFTADLEPGRYAWIAESSADKGMVVEFFVD